MDWVLLAGSLGGVLALAAIAWLLGLGGASIGGPEAAARVAEEGLHGFTAARALVSRDDKAALVRGTDGTMALLKVHGAHVAARRLPLPLDYSELPGGVRIRTGERMFGEVRLLLSAEDRDILRAML